MQGHDGHAKPTLLIKSNKKLELSDLGRLPDRT